MIEWLDSSLNTNLTKYITDHQEYTTNDTRKAKNEMINQGMKTVDAQYYNTHQPCTVSGTSIVMPVELYCMTNEDVAPNVERIACLRRKVTRMRLHSPTRWEVIPGVIIFGTYGVNQRPTRRFLYYQQVQRPKNDGVGES